MACGKKTWFMVCLIVIVSNIHILVYGAQQVPCLFIFGDSLVDNGNNNDLNTTAKANYPPYGMDFPGGHTGRFSNGRNIADIIAEHLGFESYIPPFVTAKGKEILKGVNYGSGGSGLLKETGQALGDRTSIEGQLQKHKITISKMNNILGNNKSTSKQLSKCIYAVNVGSNDYINNYFMPDLYSSSKIYTPTQYATVLIQQYSQSLKTLHHYGARKVALFGLSPIGCIPFEWKRFNSTFLCVTRVNRAVEQFNDRLKALVDELNKQLSGSNFIYVNMYRLSVDMALKPGFKDRFSSCCKVSKTIKEGQCDSEKDVCGNRKEYVYFDAFHPTDAANVILGGRAYSNDTLYDTYPMDIQTLAQLR